MTARTEEARSLSDVFAGLDDEDVRMLIDAAEPVGVGIVGTTKIARIGQTTVSVKQLPLISSEEGDPTTTASRIQLPLSATTVSEALPTESGANWRHIRRPPSGCRPER